jgi:hypothetical protein
MDALWRHWLHGQPDRPASAFGADFAFTINDTTFITANEMLSNLIAIGESDGSY